MAAVVFPGTHSFGNGFRSAITCRSRLSNSSWVHAWPGIDIPTERSKGAGARCYSGERAGGVFIEMIVACKRFQRAHKPSAVTLGFQSSAEHARSRLARHDRPLAQRSARGAFTRPSASAAAEPTPTRPQSFDLAGH